MQSPVVVLVGTSHPGNAGAAARGAANFGVTDLRFVAPRCDVRSPEALERAVHARRLLEGAQVFDGLAEALAGVGLAVGTTARATTAENRSLRKPTDVRDWAAGLRALDTRTALVFGPEDTGLTSEDVNRMDQLVTVPTADYASLNLAHAVSLLCYEHFRVREAASVTPQRRLSPDVLAAMDRAFRALAECTEPRAWRREVACAMWKRIVGRSRPDDHEVHNVMGIITNALRRFDHPDYRTEKSSRTVRERGLLATAAGDAEEE